MTTHTSPAHHRDFLRTLVDQYARGLRSGPVVMAGDPARVNEASVEWASSFGLLGTPSMRERTREIRVGELAALTFGQHQRSVVQLGSDLITWMFLFDDAVGEGLPEGGASEHAKVLASYADVLHTQRRPQDAGPFHDSLVELLVRASRLGASRAWMTRFAEDMCGYFRGCALESVLRKRGGGLELGAYCSLRAQTIGTRPVFALIELGSGRSVSTEAHRDPKFVELRRRAALLTAWVNDIYSYPKELADSDGLNLVAITLRTTPNLERSLQQVVARYNRELEEFELMARRYCTSDSHTASYLDDLAMWVHGNRAWTRVCGRYT